MCHFSPAPRMQPERGGAYLLRRPLTFKRVYCALHGACWSNSATHEPSYQNVFVVICQQTGKKQSQKCDFCGSAQRCSDYNMSNQLISPKPNYSHQNDPGG